MEVIRRGEITTWKQCRRKSWYKRSQGLIPKAKPKAFSLGDLAHVFWEELFKPPVGTAKKRAWDMFETFRRELLEENLELHLDMEKMRIILSAYYDTYWKADRARFKFLETERELQVPIIDSTGEVLEGYELGCRLDVVMEDKKTKKIWVMDHKTSATGDLDDVLLDIGDQQNLYYYAAKHEWGNRFAGLIWDIVKKSKKEVTKKDKKVAEMKGGMPEAIFLARLTQEIADDPREFFKRRPLRRTAGDFDIIRDELYWAASDLVEADKEHARATNYRCPSLECRRCGYKMLCVRDTKEMREAEFETKEEEDE